MDLLQYWRYLMIASGLFFLQRDSLAENIRQSKDNIDNYNVDIYLEKASARMNEVGRPGFPPRKEFPWKFPSFGVSHRPRNHFHQRRPPHRHPAPHHRPPPPPLQHPHRVKPNEIPDVKYSNHQNRPVESNRYQQNTVFANTEQKQPEEYATPRYVYKVPQEASYAEENGKVSEDFYTSHWPSFASANDEKQSKAAAAAYQPSYGSYYPPPPHPQSFDFTPLFLALVPICLAVGAAAAFALAGIRGGSSSPSLVVTGGTAQQQQQQQEAAAAAASSSSSSAAAAAAAAPAFTYPFNYFPYLFYLSYLLGLNATTLPE